MRRRDFIKVIAGSATAWPLAARAQQAAKLLIGFLSGGAPDDPNISAFLQGLKEGGYVEGQSVAVEYRFANGQYDRLPAFATDLAGRGVKAIFATGGGPRGKAGDCDHSHRVRKRRRSD